MVHPAFKFVAHFIGPIKTFEGLPFHAEGIGVFAIDDGTLGEDGHANETRVYGAVVNSIFEDFSGLVGVVGHFSSEEKGWKGGETTERQASEKRADGDDCEVGLFHNCDF